MINQQIQTKLNEIIEEMRQAFHVPSIMAAVTVKGQTYYCGGGSANIESGAKADENTIYAIASASKAFIAAAICILADDGKLSLDQPVKSYLKDFAMYDPYMTEHLTMRDAMSHRTGLPRHDLTWYVRPELNIRDLVDILRYMPPAYPPRSRMNYQNHMFTLATVVVEEISGMSWDKFVKSRILDPLGMSRTFCLPAQFRSAADNIAQPYIYKDGAIKGTPYLDISNVGCAGCISSTVKDLAIWAQLNAGRGRLGDVRIFSEERADDLHMPQMIIKPGEMSSMHFDEVTHTSYGLGWFIESYRGHTLVHHGGTIDGFKSLVGFLPGHDVSFAILTNLNGNQTPAALGYAICDLTLQLEPIDWCAKMLAEVSRIGKLSSNKTEKLMARTKNPQPFGHPLEDYCGVYENGAYGRVEITVENGMLSGHMGTASCRILPAGYESFILSLEETGDAAPGMFRCDFDGNITGFGARLEPNLGDFIEFVKIH